jgi:hypothetical protein
MLSHLLIEIIVDVCMRASKSGNVGYTDRTIYVILADVALTAFPGSRSHHLALL